MARPRRQRQFDPYGILVALDEQRISYVLIGAFARVIEASDEVTLGVDFTPSTSPENLRRLELALAGINARRPNGHAPGLARTDFDREPVVELETDHGEVKIVPFPEGTRGYEDLRRAAIRQLLHTFWQWRLCCWTQPWLRPWLRAQVSALVVAR